MSATPQAPAVFIAQAWAAPPSYEKRVRFLSRAFSSFGPAREAAADLLFKLVQSAVDPEDFRREDMWKYGPAKYESLWEACGEEGEGGVQWALEDGGPDVPAFAQVLKFTLGERASKPEVVCSIPKEDEDDVGRGEAEEEEMPRECDPECHDRVSAEEVASASRWSAKRPREDSEWTFLVVSRAIAPVYDMTVRACRAVSVSAEEASSLAEDMLLAWV